MQRFQQSLDKLTKEFDDLVEEDSRLPLKERHSFAASAGCTPLAIQSIREVPTAAAGVKDKACPHCHSIAAAARCPRPGFSDIRRKQKAGSARVL